MDLKHNIRFNAHNKGEGQAESDKSRIIYTLATGGKTSFGKKKKKDLHIKLNYIS